MEEVLTLKDKTELSCTICDKCCEYRGDIKITPINVIEISKFLNISIDEFLDKYTEKVEAPEIVIKGVGEKRECIFNDRKTFKCEIQKVKPMQCVMFPLAPFSIEQDLFVNTYACPISKGKVTKVDKWLNGNNNIYKRNKYIYLKWIDFMSEIQPQWKLISIENQNKIYDLLYKEYDLNNKNYEKQILNNINEARSLVYADRKSAEE